MAFKPYSTLLLNAIEIGPEFLVTRMAKELK